MNNNPGDRASEEFDFIVVGSGAGGGPLAARLAQNGFRVLVIEAGSGEDGRRPAGGVARGEPRAGAPCRLHRGSRAELAVLREAL